MKSGTTYILVCMLLMTALISLIVLLITITEQPPDQKEFERSAKDGHASGGFGRRKAGDHRFYYQTENVNNVDNTLFNSSVLTSTADNKDSQFGQNIKFENENVITSLSTTTLAPTVTGQSFDRNQSSTLENVSTKMSGSLFRGSTATQYTTNTPISQTEMLLPTEKYYQSTFTSLTTPLEELIPERRFTIKMSQEALDGITTEAHANGSYRTQSNAFTTPIFDLTSTNLFVQQNEAKNVSANDSSGKFLSICVDMGVPSHTVNKNEASSELIFAPKNNGEIHLFSRRPRRDSIDQEKDVNFVPIGVIQTQLRRIHRLKLLTNEDSGGSVLSADPAKANARFVAIDGDELRRLVRLDVDGNVLHGEAWLRATLSAKDLAVGKDGRIYVLIRQHNEIYVYTERLTLVNHFTFSSGTSQDSCNFVESSLLHIYVSCQTGILQINKTDGTILKRFGVPEGSYSLGIRPLSNGYLLAVQRGREELHLFNSNAELVAKLINQRSTAPTIWSSIAVYDNSTILVLEYLHNTISSYNTTLNLNHFIL